MDATHTKNLLKQKYGFEENIKYTYDFDTEFDYLNNKYKLGDYEQTILYYILNVNYKETVRNEDGFHLFISLYNAIDHNRAIELLFCLSKNLQNINISKVHILYEVSSDTKNDNINLITEIIYLLEKYIHLPIITTYHSERPSFQYIFEYCNKQIQGKVILSNADIIYDDTLKQIINIDDKQFLCISRKYKEVSLEDNTVHWETIILKLPEKYPQDLINCFSHDTWIFCSPMKYPIDIDIGLGEMFCDSYLNIGLKNSKYQCYNLADDINCFHIQDDETTSDKISKDPVLQDKLLNKLWEKEKQKGNNIEKKTDCLACLLVTDISHYYNKIHANWFFIHSDYINKISN